MIEIKTSLTNNDKHTDMDEPSALNLHKCLVFSQRDMKSQVIHFNQLLFILCQQMQFYPLIVDQPLRSVMMMKKSMSTSLLCYK